MNVQPLPIYTYDKFGAFVAALELAPEVSRGCLVYRLPKWATIVKAPTFEPPETAVFLESTQSWISVSDHRGETWLDELRRPVKIERLGNPELWGWKRWTTSREACSTAQ